MKKLLTILVLIMLIISFFQITSMFALYKNELQSEYSTLLGLWTIKVNGTDITTGGQEVEFNISDGQVKYVSSDYVQTNTIAPGSEAYFEIEIDPSNTDVSIIYQLDLGTIATGSNETSTAAIQLTNAENYFKKNLEDENETPVENSIDYTEDNLYKSIIPIDLITQGYKNYVRVYFKWVNNEENNATDSALGSTEQVVEGENGETTTVNSTLTVPVQINLKQYIGEELSNEEAE